jgi:hypothetical protein
MIGKNTIQGDFNIYVSAKILIRSEEKKKFTGLALDSYLPLRVRQRGNAIGTTSPLQQ